MISRADALKRLAQCRELQPEAMQVLVGAEIVDALIDPPVFRAPTCVCGHPVGDHKSAGTVWPHPPRYGFCFVDGCGCKSYEEVPRERAA